jgi:hypothetical protein
MIENIGIIENEVFPANQTVARKGEIQLVSVEEQEDPEFDSSEGKRSKTYFSK